MLIGNSDLVPQGRFASNFLLSIKISGFVSIGFLVYALIRPYIPKAATEIDDLQWAKMQLKLYGNSSLDYFKTYKDKLIFRQNEGFLAYRLSGNFAVVLECPVSAIENRKVLISSFDRYCQENGLKSIYYRVPEDSLQDFYALGKRKLFLGQEGDS